MKRLNHNTRVLVTDGGRAIVFRNAGQVGRPDLQQFKAYHQDNPPNREQATDKPSRVQESVGQRRSSAEQPDYHQQTEDRFIRDIELVYKKRESYRGTATVEVWGEYAEGWIDNEAQQYRGGWVLLSSRAARFVGFEKDVAEVPRNKGGFRRLKVDVRDRDITLRRLTVTYGDGEKDELVSQSQKVENGKALTFDLRRGNRPVPIKEIEAEYRSRIFDRESKGGRSIVEISAQR